ncbi:MAG: helix-turn-helix transcriptional regulator [Candidatus Enterosoma sp.]|nr:helix-turn-helix transcriptional regulator [bacterium]MDY5548312.1 helix-turn-helix transcriptional regulator [Candidatus Enterosoma sp.]
MSKHSIGKTIATLRKAKGWTQVELAEKLNVSDKAVSKWESEAGLPEISQLPTMATLFGVTIDYLLTGKTPEKEIVTISKAELCAKTDDVSLAEEVKDLPHDENNKKIVDYILQYQSLNVFKKLCEIDSSFINRFKMLDAMRLAVVSNSLSILVGKVFSVDGNCKFTFENEDEIKSLLPVEDKEYFRNYQDQCICLIPRDFFTLLVTDKRINETTLNTLLSNQNGRECVWYHAFPYLIDEAYKNGNDKLLLKLLDISRKNNAIAYETIDPIVIYDSSYDYVLNYFFIASKYGNKGHGLVRVLESTIKAALEKGDFDMVQEFNNINIDVENFVTTKFRREHESVTKSKCYVATSDEIRVAKLKLDKSVSRTDLEIQSAIHNGIVDIKEVKGIADFKAVKKALNDYPVHPFELVYRMYQQQKWRELFEFSVDYDINRLSDAILYQSKEDIEENILEIWTKDNQPYNRLKSLCFNNNELYVSRSEISYGSRTNHNQKSIQEVIDYLNDVRQRIISELSNKFDKEKIVGELTKDYFYSELSKGNMELVIIKLCVRMEAILKYDYNYQGDFSEMLDRFCGQFNTYDDEMNNYDPYTPDMLNRLRRQRNSIVHSEKTDKPMSDYDIKQCIEYICSL